MIPYQSQSVSSDPSLVQSAAAWAMNQRDPIEQQIDPSFPILSGVDGRETACLRRFPGFMRLDYDQREFCEAAASTLVPNVDHVIFFKTVSLDAPGGVQFVGYVVGTYNPTTGAGDITLYYRLLGDTLRDALKVQRLDNMATASEFVVTATAGTAAPRITCVAIGRALYVSHSFSNYVYMFMLSRADPIGAPTIYTMTCKRAGANAWDWPIDTLSGYDYVKMKDVGFSNVSGQSKAFNDTDIGATMGVGPAVRYPATDRLYVCAYEVSAVRIKSAGRIGGAAYATVSTETYMPISIAVNPATGMLYYIEGGGVAPHVHAIKYDGTGKLTLASGADVTSPKGICINTVDSQAFWADGSTIRKLSKLDGTGVVSTLLTTSESTPGIDATACDDAQDLIFWVDNANAKLKRAVMSSGSGEANVLASVTHPGIFGLACDTVNHRLFFTDTINNAIYMVRQGGTVAELLVTGLPYQPWSISYDSDQDLLIVEGRTGTYPTYAYAIYIIEATDPGGAYNNAPHVVGSKLRARCRYVNKTTGFVGPMSDPISLQLLDSSDVLKYASGEIFVGATAADNWTGPVIDNVWFAYGVNWAASATQSERVTNLIDAINNSRVTTGYPRVFAKASATANTITLVSTVPGPAGDGISIIDSRVTFDATKYVVKGPTLVGGSSALPARRRKLAWGAQTIAELPAALVRCLGPIAASGAVQHEIYLQIFCTQSVGADSPSDGLGEYFLDQEIPITRLAEPDNGSGGSEPLCHDDSTMPPAIAFTGVPQKSNDELAASELYNPDTDDPGEIKPCEALGQIDGLLLSLQGTTQEADSADISRADIRVSPPEKTYPSWVEAISANTLRRLKPRPATQPVFVDAVGLTYYASHNRMVRIQRNLDTILWSDVQDGIGPSNPEAICSSGGSLYIVSDQGCLEINANSGDWAPILLVHRIITKRWASHVAAGRIICGYDAQLHAIFFSFKCWDETANLEYRGEAFILWLGTGKVTHLYDCYWMGMGAGTHPLTGKQVLYILHRNGSIIYPCDSLTVAGTGSMTGANGYTPHNIVGPGDDTYQNRSGETFGGVLNGKVGTAVHAGGGTPYYTITDSIHSKTAGGTFDQFGYLDTGYHGDPVHSHLSGALIYSRVYFFRWVADPNDSTKGRVCVVADALIKANTANTFVIYDADTVYRTNPYTGVTFSTVLANDQFSISPVVLQIVAAPIRFLQGIEYLTQQVTCSTLWYAAGNLNSTYAEAIAYTYPPAVFMGITTPVELDAATVGRPLLPTVEGVGALAWGPSALPEKTAVAAQRKGNCLIPVLTCYGARYDFDVHALFARASYDSDSSSTR